MSVQTTADTALQAAKDHVNSAIKELSKILIDECYGHDYFSSTYLLDLEEVFEELRSLKKKLNP